MTKALEEDKKDISTAVSLLLIGSFLIVATSYFTWFVLQYSDMIR